jgi:hypothetical protein
MFPQRSPKFPPEKRTLETLHFLPAAPTLVLSFIVQMFLKKEEGKMSPEKLTRNYFWGARCAGTAALTWPESTF